LFPFLGKASAQSQLEEAIEDWMSPLFTLFKIKRDQSHLGGNEADREIIDTQRDREIIFL
jgi:hypothetical protein